MDDDRLLQVITVFLLVEWVLLLLLEPAVALIAAVVWVVGWLRGGRPHLI